jgi:ferric-dicitrate binding protein FerR (iron transport regulator)
MSPFDPNQSSRRFQENASRDAMNFHRQMNMHAKQYRERVDRDFSRPHHRAAPSSDNNHAKPRPRRRRVALLVLLLAAGAAIVFRRPDLVSSVLDIAGTILERLFEVLRD